jgi:signal transduction histidine kinase
VLQVVLAHRSAGGEVEFFSTIATDLSQRVETERRLRDGETMAALGSLVAGVAHEVRNPLFGMTSTLDAFEVRLGGNPDYRPYLDVLRGELARLNGLMHDLLEYARPTRTELAPGRFEEVVDRALEACASLRERSGVEVVASLAPGLPPVRMDRARLAHAVLQLLESAIERTRPGACVRLSVWAARAAAAARLECRIDDDGPATAELARVFEPFFARRRSGTGLGLAIARRIVADHGGSLSAESRDGGGVSFALSLPAEP